MSFLFEHIHYVITTEKPVGGMKRVARDFFFNTSMDFFLLLSFEYCSYTAATFAALSNKKSDKHGKSNNVCVRVRVCCQSSVTDDIDTFLLEIIQIDFSVMQPASIEYVYYLLV